MTSEHSTHTPVPVSQVQAASTVEIAFQAPSPATAGQRTMRQGRCIEGTNVFRTQTGENINVAANGIATLLRMMIEEDN